MYIDYLEQNSGGTRIPRFDDAGGIGVRIVMLADRLILGGLETHIITFCNELLRRGHRILLYAAYAEPDIIAAIGRNNGNFLYHNWEDRIPDEVRRFNPEIIHSHPFTAIIRGYDLAVMFQKPFFITIHGLYDFGVDRSPLGRQITSQAQRIIAVDQAVASLLRSNTPCPEKVTIIGNGIDLTSFQPFTPVRIDRAVYGLEPNWYTIVIISRLADGKEGPVRQLIHCAHDLAARLKGLNLLIAGDGPYLEPLRNLATRSAVYPDLRMRLLGKVNDVRGILSLADHVMACDRAALEAMACRRPVYAMNGSGFGGGIGRHNFEKLLGERSGYQVMTDDALISSLYAFVKNKTLRRRLAGEGMAVIHRYFDINNAVSQLEQVYQS